MQIVSNGDNLHAMSNPVVWENKKKITVINLSFAELAQRMVNVKLEHHENTLIQNFTTKIWKFSDKDSDIFHISAQNIDCWYSLEPPCRGGSNDYQQSMFWTEIRKIMYTPVNRSFTI